MLLQAAPGPTGLRLIQSILGFYRAPLQMFDNVVRRYGDVARIELGSYHLHVIVQPAHIKHVLQDNNTNYRIAGIFDAMRPVVGQGLTTNDGDSWRRQRRLVQPALHRQTIGAYATQIVSATTHLIEKWKADACHRASYDIWPDLLTLNHRILGQLLFGVDLITAQPEVVAALEVVRAISVKRATALFKSPNPWPSLENNRFERAVKRLNEFAYDRIDAHRRESITGDVLAMLLEARDENGEGMTTTQVHDEIMTLFFAAYEDPANTLAWAWYLLANNPAVEQRLRAELADVLQGQPPALSDLARLPYTTMVIDETLRLYPPTWGILRDAVAEDQLGGYIIPAGSSVYIDLFHTHRLPNYWPNPEQFDPFRFATETTVSRPRFAYLPFGGGPRQCIGNSLAMMEMQIVLAMLTQAFHLQLIPDFRVAIDASNSLRPNAGLKMKLIGVEHSHETR